MENLGWWMTATQVNPSSVAICGALKQATRAPTSSVSCGTHAMEEQAMDSSSPCVLALTISIQS